MSQDMQKIKNEIKEGINRMTRYVENPEKYFKYLLYRTRGDFLRKWGLRLNPNLSYGFLGFDQKMYNEQLKKLWELSTSNINKNPSFSSTVKKLLNPINIIPNTGNTCFIDSLLVAILANPTKMLRKKLTEYYKNNTELAKSLQDVDNYINKRNNNIPEVQNLAKLLGENLPTILRNSQFSRGYIKNDMNDPIEFLNELFKYINLGITFTDLSKIKYDVEKFQKTFKNNLKNYKNDAKLWKNSKVDFTEDDKDITPAIAIAKNILNSNDFNDPGENFQGDIKDNIHGLVKSTTVKNDLGKMITKNFKSVTYTIGTTAKDINIPFITTTTTTITPLNAPLYIQNQPNRNNVKDITKPLILSEYVKKKGKKTYELRSIVVFLSNIHYVCFFKKDYIWWLYDDSPPKLQKFNNFKEVLSHPNNPQENCVILCYECLADKTFKVDSTPNTAHVLASGGFGMVVADGNIARKLMYSKTTCDAAAIEYHNINTLYNAFKRARNSSKDRAVSAALHILKPLVPRGFLKEPFKFSIGTNVETFSCQLLTDRIPGLSTMQLPHDNLVAAVRQHFPEILVMPVFEFQSRLSLKNPNEGFAEIPERNFPRYYISNMDEVGKIYPTIDFLHEFPYAMGVLLAVFVFEAKLSMINVEILLGGTVDIYIVDLGMCNDISEIVDSGDLYELSAILTDISGPFYTKNSFPLPTNETQYGSFTKGLWDAGVDMGVTTEFLQLFLEQLHHDLM